MLRRPWKPIVATAAAGGAAYYFAYRNSQPTFKIPVRSTDPDGKRTMTTRTIPILSLKTIEERINQNATSNSHTSPGGIDWNYSTASLASNDPIEDANATQIVRRDDSDPSAPGDYLFFAVMDGHSGPHTSRLLSKVLTKAVALEISKLSSPSDETQGTPGVLASVSRLIRGGTNKSISPTQTTRTTDPKSVSSAIVEAYERLDTELINAPLRILANNLDEESKKDKTIPDLSHHPLALTSMHPAVSGSCALMAIFDTVNRDLYVACTGDSRAVAGVWEPSEDGKGQWRIEVLSEDQTGRNPNEAERIRSEHPADESDHVVHQGRILGGLEPTRAFGDARYKWPRRVQETLNQAFMIGNGKPLRPPPAVFKTPPYVTARPVVTHHNFTFPPSTPTAPSQDAKKPIRFLVLATDGLWDELSNSEVVSLVAGHLTGLKGTIPKATLPSVINVTAGSSSGISGKATAVAQKGKEKATKEGNWAFKDENLSVHLIRNAFGGGDEPALTRLLSIPAPYSRRYRDDTTVTVIWWREGAEPQAGVETIKAKL